MGELHISPTWIRARTLGRAGAGEAVALRHDSTRVLPWATQRSATATRARDFFGIATRLDDAMRWRRHLAEVEERLLAVELPAHAALPRLIDSVVTDGLVYDVFDLPAESGPVRTGELQPGEAAAFGAPIGDALAQLHDGGWTHQAVTPGVVHGNSEDHGVCFRPTYAFTEIGGTPAPSLTQWLDFQGAWHGNGALPQDDVAKLAFVIGTWMYGGRAFDERNAGGSRLPPVSLFEQLIDRHETPPELAEVLLQAVAGEVSAAELATRLRDFAAAVGSECRVEWESVERAQPRPGIRGLLPCQAMTLEQLAASPDPSTDAALAADGALADNEDALGRFHPSNVLLERLQSGRMPSFDERYRIEEWVGGGGFGQVERVYDRLLDRRVAMKRLYAHDEPPALLLEQFVKEVRVMARFDHPQLLRVLDMGIDGDGRHYFTMPFLAGETLQQQLPRLFESSRLSLIDYPFRRLASVVAKLAAGIEHAHDLGVLHLDLKPQNILLGTNGEVAVIDWGLAVLEDSPEVLSRFASLYHDVVREGSDGSEVEEQTRAFGFDGLDVVGTAAYMAPEQAAAGSPVDRRSDVYGLGGILYFCLCGAAPNEGAGDAARLDAARNNSRPRPPSARVPHAQVVVPPGLEAIALAALERDPDRRYPDVPTLRRELERWLQTAGASG